MSRSTEILISVDHFTVLLKERNLNGLIHCLLNPSCHEFAQ